MSQDSQAVDRNCPLSCGLMLIFISSWSSCLCMCECVFQVFEKLAKWDEDCPRAAVAEDHYHCLSLSSSPDWLVFMEHPAVQVTASLSASSVLTGVSTQEINGKVSD